MTRHYGRASGAWEPCRCVRLSGSCAATSTSDTVQPPWWRPRHRRRFGPHHCHRHAHRLTETGTEGDPITVTVNHQQHSDLTVFPVDSEPVRRPHRRLNSLY